MVAPSTRATYRSEDLPNERGPRLELAPLLQREGAAQLWHRYIKSEDAPVALDLFCGAGGLSQGLQDAGFVVSAGLDHDPRAVETHAGNFLANSRALDLTGITSDGVRSLIHDELGIPRVDVIVGGPPCQGFASVGRAKIRSLGTEQRERALARNHLYREFVTFVDALQPLCFVMENVPHLATFQEGRVEALIREDFDRIGYDIGTSDAPGRPLMLEAAEYGVPQTRRRIFFLGFRRGVTSAVQSPSPTHTGKLTRDRPRQLPELGNEMFPLIPRQGLGSRRWTAANFRLPLRTLADAISDLAPLQAPAVQHVMRYVRQHRPDLGEREALTDPSYAALMRAGMPQDEEHVLYDHVVRGVREDDRLAFEHIEEGGTYLDVPEGLRRYDSRSDHFEDRYYRLPWNLPSRAITAHIAKDGYWYIHPDKGQVRTLSVREAARVQSFPDHFRFAGHRTAMYRMIGNAVPPLLAAVVARLIAEAIERRASPSWSPPLTPERQRQLALIAD